MIKRRNGSNFQRFLHCKKPDGRSVPGMKMKTSFELVWVRDDNQRYLMDDLAAKPAEGLRSMRRFEQPNVEWCKCPGMNKGAAAGFELEWTL